MKSPVKNLNRFRPRDCHTSGAKIISNEGLIGLEKALLFGNDFLAS